MWPLMDSPHQVRNSMEESLGLGLGIGDQDEIVVISIDPGSPADRWPVALEVNDHIVAVAGRPISADTDFGALLTMEGLEVRLTIKRQLYRDATDPAAVPAQGQSEGWTSHGGSHRGFDPKGATTAPPAAVPAAGPKKGFRPVIETGRTPSEDEVYSEDVSDVQAVVAATGCSGETARRVIEVVGGSVDDAIELVTEMMQPPKKSARGGSGAWSPLSAARRVFAGGADS